MKFHKIKKFEDKTKNNSFTFGSKIKLKSFSNQIRKLGSFLSGMVIPAIGVFIAWGLLTAFFIPTGWIPNAQLSAIVGPTIIYIIPALIAFFGGKQIYGLRGALIGLIATMGVVIGGQSQYFQTLAGIVPDANGKLPPNAPMLLGAMICGPLAAWILMHLEKFWKPKIPQGYEMLVNNFSMGISGFLFMVGAYWGITPFIAWFQLALGFIISNINANNLNWLLPIFVEPEKVLFLNNAVNHGIFTPLGLSEVVSPAFNFCSYLLLLDPNPGQGLGLLLAYYFFAKSNETRSQALSAIPIHFVGGIHEVYFPFILMKPFLIIFMIIGGIFNVLVYQIFGVGSIGINSPGSVISVYTFIAKDSYLGLTISVFGSAGIVFALSSMYLIIERKHKGEKVFVNPKLAWLNARISKTFKQSNLSTKPFFLSITNLNYLSVNTNKKYKFEWIKYVNKKNDVRLLSLNYLEIKYFIYTKYHKEKEYLLMIYKKTKINFLDHIKTKIKQKIYAKKYKTFFALVKNNFDLKTNYLKWIKLSKEERENKIVSITYTIIPYVRKFRTYNFIDQKNKKLKFKKEEIAFNAIQENLDQIKKEKTKLKINNKQNLLENQNLIKQIGLTKKIIFACEAGMGSSAMGATIVSKMLKNVNANHIVVINKALKDLKIDDKFVIVQENFKSFVSNKYPQTYIYTIKQYLAKKDYEKLINSAKIAFKNK